MAPNWQEKTFFVEITWRPNWHEELFFGGHLFWSIFRGKFGRIRTKFLPPPKICLLLHLWLTIAIFLHKMVWNLAHKTINDCIYCILSDENSKCKFKLFRDPQWKVSIQIMAATDYLRTPALQDHSQVLAKRQKMQQETHHAPILGGWCNWKWRYGSEVEKTLWTIVELIKKQ